MNDENELDLQTFQVYPDEEPVKKQEDKSKKGSPAKTIKDKVRDKVKVKDNPNPFSGIKQKKTGKSFNELLNKITPVTACIIGMGIVFVYIAFDILTSI